MKLFLHLKKVLFIFTITIFCFKYTIAQNTDDKASDILADSIYAMLNSKADSALLEKSFAIIKKQRRELKGHYVNLLFKYENICRNNNYPKGSMEALDRIGLQYRYNGVYDSAEIYHKKSLEMALKLKDSTQLYYNYNNLGQVFRMQDFSVQAIYYFHKALKISEKLGNLKSASYTMNSLGAAYVVQKNYNLAMLYFKKSAKIADLRGDKRTVAYNYGSMGEVFMYEHALDSAMHYFVESKKIIIELDSKKGRAVAEHLIGQAHFAMGNYKEAEHFIKKAIPMHIKDNNTRYLSLCYAYLGKIKTKQHINDSAEYYLIKAQLLAELVHSYENIILTNNAMFELFKETKQFEKAIEAMQKSKAFEDSIISIANAKELQSLEIAYETDKKEQQIKLLSAENEIKSQRFKISLILILVLLIGIIMGIYVQEMRKRQAELTQNKLRQQLLISQMNPHFIFNALASIQSYMYKNEAKKAAVFLGNFSSLTRSILNNSSQDSIPLNEEIDTLRNYLELETLRMNGAFDYQINFSKEMDTEMIFIPPMMLQPFIENSVKHGLRTIGTGGLITLNFTEKVDQVEIEIIDNGIGVNAGLANPDKVYESKATEIFKQRLKVLQKKYRNITEPIIIDRSVENKSGTKVLVCLPIIME
ncbi:MAG: histidine kinase [Salinivirgaceae bacterium]|jgi:tetratricopeptide (TPR) repeat protein|nr:histidine kinase [Salinivirgaceae bacterium]